MQGGTREIAKRTGHGCNFSRPSILRLRPPSVHRPPATIHETLNHDSSYNRTHSHDTHNDTHNYTHNDTHQYPHN